MKYDRALNRPIIRPTKLVAVRTSLLTLGYVRVKRAMMTGVVGQYMTPKEELSRNKGLKSGFSCASIGDQKARKAKGKTQYRHAGSLSKT